MKSKNEAKKRAVLVTTSKRGVFFGYTTEPNGPTMNLKRARLCLYWTKAMQGFMGLAAVGPDRECRIGKAVDIYLPDVTSICDVTTEATKNWEKQSWK